MPRTIFWVAGWVGLVIAAAVIAAVVIFVPHAPIGAAIFLGCFFGIGMMCVMVVGYARVWVMAKGIEHVARTIERQKPQQLAPHTKHDGDAEGLRPPPDPTHIP
jgi:NhaP-type Na+/H+ and K+/H+ antiporter